MNSRRRIRHPSCRFIGTLSRSGLHAKGPLSCGPARVAGCPDRLRPASGGAFFHVGGPPYEGSGHRRVPHPAGRKAKECCPVSAVGPHRCRVTVSARCQNQDRRPPPRFTTPVAGLAAWKTRERWRDVPVVSHGSNPRAHQRSEALHDGALPICQSRRRIAGATDHEQRDSWCWLRQTLDRTGRTPSPWRH
jgi:hypothetical protein